MRFSGLVWAAAAAAALTAGEAAMAAQTDHETKGVTENNLPVFYQNGFGPMPARRIL